MKRILIPLLLAVTALPLSAQQSPDNPDARIPVADARKGFTPAQARDLLGRYSYEETIKAGDVALFFSLNVGQSVPTAVIARAGDVVALNTAVDPRIGATRVATAAGEMSLNDYLVHPASRAQGMVVVHHGRIVFEEYPGMREFDAKAWMSNSKTTVSLVVRLLAEEGKIDVNRPVDGYLADLRGTEWAGTRVIDVLDMASGMDILETQENRLNPRSLITRFNLAFNGKPNADGKVERQIDVIRSARRIKPAGQSFDYSSLNTAVLILLAEAVENKRWHDIFQERVWGKMTVEGDMQVGIAPDGTPQAYGFLMARLRDMARYGMLYTPSWGRAARERIVSPAYMRELQTGGRKGIFLKGELGNRLTKTYFPKSPPAANHWQWDGVWADGDLFKSGVYGQGIYVSPAKDLVIVWQSTAPTNDLTQYARAIALATPALKQ